MKHTWTYRIEIEKDKTLDDLDGTGGKKMWKHIDNTFGHGNFKGVTIHDQQRQGSKKIFIIAAHHNEPERAEEIAGELELFLNLLGVPYEVTYPR